MLYVHHSDLDKSSLQSIFYGLSCDYIQNSFIFFVRYKMMESILLVINSQSNSVFFSNEKPAIVRFSLLLPVYLFLMKNLLWKVK